MAFACCRTRRPAQVQVDEVGLKSQQHDQPSNAVVHERESPQQRAQIIDQFLKIYNMNEIEIKTGLTGCSPSLIPSLCGNAGPRQTQTSSGRALLVGPPPLHQCRCHCSQIQS